MTLPRPSILAILLFLLAMVVLIPGISEITGVTGKDEYLLGLRTPMHMLEGHHGWLPWLDGEPRLKKPPLIYWLGKLSYETFGVSLFAGRIIGVIFAALLTVTSALIAWCLLSDRRYMLLSGLVVLGSIGVMIDGRRLMLDIPVAALSALAILFLLRWRRSGYFGYAPAAGISLGLAFLVKGPVGLFFFGAALVALLLASPGSAAFLKRKWLAALTGMLSFAAVGIPWFVYIYLHYPDLLAETFSTEVAERELFNVSLSPLFSLLLMALPWSPVAIAVMLRRDPATTVSPGWINIRRFLAVWMIVSLLPFFFFKSFSRYLYGCMVPLSLLAGLLVFAGASWEKYRPWLRTGGVLAIITASLLVFILLWFRGWQPVVIAPILFILAFALCWLQPTELYRMAALSILLWLGAVSMVYPAIGINRLPQGVLAMVKGEYVVLFAGPQPAMLPIASGMGMRDTSRLASLPAAKRDQCGGFLLFSPTRHFITAEHQLRELGHRWTELGRFRVLSSRGSWINIANEDATRDDWVRAFQSHDLDSLATELILVRSTAEKCL